MIRKRPQRSRFASRAASRRSYPLTNLDDDQIKLFLQQESITPEIEAAFRKIVEQKGRVAALDEEIAKRRDETQKIYDDQQRLRENLKALKGSPEERALTQRYTQQLANQETRLANVAARVSGASGEARSGAGRPRQYD